MTACSVSSDVVAETSDAPFTWTTDAEGDVVRQHTVVSCRVVFWM